MVDTIAGDITTTATIGLNVSVYGRIDDGADQDWYRIYLPAGTYEFRMHGEGIDEVSDPRVFLHDAAGVQIAFNDDSASWDGANGLDSRLIYTITTPGTYYVNADSFGSSFGDYLLTVVPQNVSGMIFTVDEIAWQISENYNSFYGGVGTAAWDVGVDGSLTYNIANLDATGQALAIAALQMWTDVTGIAFVQTSGAAEITFDDSDPGVSAYANWSSSGTTITSANVMVTTGWLTQFGNDFSSYSFETYIHEIGHALGLGHGGVYDGSATYGVDNYYYNESIVYTIMSYMNANNDEFTSAGRFNPNLPADFRYMLTPAIADIIAIQNQYGSNTSTRTGNTTYGYNSNTGNAVLDSATSIGGDMFMTVYDDGGIDTLDFSGYAGAQFISLIEEQASNVLGGIWNLWIARDTEIENAIGGSGNDVIRGNDLANTLNGGLGTDSLYGNAGNDIYFVTFGDNVFENANEGADTVRAAGSAYYLTGSAHVEFLETTNVTGTSAVTLVGNELAQTIRGNYGDNTLVGSAGIDSFVGYFGNDIYVVDNAAETIVEVAGQGTDAVYTTVSFALAAGLSIERLVAAPLASTNAINLVGNEIGQVIVGNNGVNFLYGGGGNDSIYGYGGNDYIRGDGGNDSLFGGTGVDQFVFREALGAASGIDRIYDLTAADTIVIDALAVATQAPITPNQFRLGTAAGDADDRIIYDATSGAFWFDPDGTGAQAAILFGVIDGAPAGINYTYFDLA